MGRAARHAIGPAPGRAAVLSRRGASLVELLVALSLGGVVLAAAAGSLLRQQRAAGWVGRLAGGEAQMRPLTLLLPSELAHLDAAAMDIVAGEAADTAIQIRALVGSSVACDATPGSVTLLPPDAAGVPLAGLAQPPRMGDSLWHYEGDSIGWLGRQVSSVTGVDAACLHPPGTGRSHRLAVDGPGSVSPGAPVRLTRHERFVVYRAADGRWYLGLREWSVSTGRFTPPQPIAGAFVRRRETGEITGFRYFARDGAELPSPVAVTADIGRVRVSILAALPGSVGADSIRLDSADVALRGHGAP